MSEKCAIAHLGQTCFDHICSSCQENAVAESQLLALYRKKRAVDGGSGTLRRSWDAIEHGEVDRVIEEAERALAS